MKNDQVVYNKTSLTHEQLKDLKLSASNFLRLFDGEYYHSILLETEIDHYIAIVVPPDYKNEPIRVTELNITDKEL